MSFAALPLSRTLLTGRTRVWLLALSAAGLLSACGDGREADTAAEAPVTVEAVTADAPMDATPDLAAAASQDAEAAALTLAAAQGAFPHDGSDIAPDDQVRYGVLDNGLRYAVLANDTPSNEAALRLRIDMGSLHEAEEERGLAHFVEHMAFNGTTNIAEDEMIAMLERYGLAFGADTNAYTSFHETVYQLDLPSTEEDTLDTGLFILREMAGEALFDPEAVERERGVVLSEERVRNTFGIRYLRERNKFLFPDAKISQRLPIGLVEVIENAPAERMRALYNGYYTPERTFVVAVGDFDVDAVEAKIRTVFSGWEPTTEPRPDPDLGNIPPRDTEAGFFTDPDMYTLVGLYAVTPPTKMPDTALTRRRLMLRSLGAGVVQRRLQRLARDPDAQFLQGQVSFDNVYGTDTADMAVMELVAEPQDWRAALGVAEQELRRALEHGFTRAEVNEQLAVARSALENAADQADTRETAALADGLAGAFSQGDVFSHPSDDLARLDSFADDITPEAVHAAFRAQWAGTAPLIFVSNNMPIPEAEATILSVYEDSRAVAVEPPVDVAATAFAYSSFGEPGAVASSTVTAVGDIRDVHQYTFENGVRLNVTPTEFERDVVRVNVRVGGGLLELPAELEGLRALYDNAFIVGGLEAHSIDELQSMLAGRTVGLNSQVGDDAFVFSAATTPEDVLLQLQLFAAYLTAPGYRPEGEAQYRQYFNVVYDTFDSQPASVRRRDAPRILRSGDRRYGIPAKEALLARSYDELAQATARAFTEGAVEIAMVGDLTLEDAVAAVAQTFGALPPRRETPERFDDARQVAFPTDRTPLTLTHAGEANQAEVNIYWPTADDGDLNVVRRLTLLERVMDLKMIGRVREQDGAAYSPRVSSISSSVNPGYGFMAVSIAVEPERVEDVFAVINEITAAVAAGAISADELERARRPLLEQIESGWENNRFWLQLIDTAQTDARRLNAAAARADAYRAITVDELTALAAEYLQPERALRIAILPDK